MTREDYPKCQRCADGRMANNQGGSMWCDRCESNGNVLVAVDGKQVAVARRIEAFMLKAAAGRDPQYTVWKMTPPGVPWQCLADTQVIDVAEGDEFQTSPPATFG